MSLIELKQITKSYPLGDGYLQILKGIDLTIEKGDFVAIMGPSGSGKSTCARLAARLWDASSGTISVGGVDVSTVEPETLLSDYAVVFQDVVLHIVLQRSVWEVTDEVIVFLSEDIEDNLLFCTTAIEGPL